ncbi:MAG: Hsp20/alpha crystallin family protein [Halobacteriales archaeon]
MRGNRDDDDPFDEVFREIERLMDEMMGVDADIETSVKTGGESNTHADVHEYDDRIVVIADLPGVEKDDIELKCDGRIVSIHASSDARSYDERVRLPSRVNEHSAEATYNNGVLEVTFDRAEDSADIDVS